MEDQESFKCQEIREEVRRCLARVMDDCELEIGDSPRWKFFRSRLLKLFGDRGLEGRVIEIMASAGGRGGR
jgi:hypothetical protein